jgi:hypothetical protein
MKKLDRATLRKIIAEQAPQFPESGDPRDLGLGKLLDKGTEMYSDYQEKRRRMSVEDRLTTLEDQMAEMMEMLRGMQA